MGREDSFNVEEGLRIWYKSDDWEVLKSTSLLMGLWSTAIAESLPRIYVRDR